MGCGSGTSPQDLPLLHSPPCPLPARSAPALPCVGGTGGGGVTVCENPNTALAHTAQKRVAKQDYEKKIIIIGPHGYGVYLCTNTMQVGG